MQLVGFSFAKLPFHRFAFAIAFALCFALVFSALNETDKSALLAFKDGITEDPLEVLNSWNNTVNFCQWYGVTCSRRHHNKVTVLDLNSQKLSGSISPHIGNLSFLRELSLYNNSFDHEIPPQIGQLHRLRILHLHYNSLVGEIPKNISSCFNLFSIILAFNQLSGEVPLEIGSLVKLQQFVLRRNNLTGRVPSSIGNLSLVKELDLDENNLGGNLPWGLGQLTQLIVLALAVNQLSGTIPPSLYNLSSLAIFDVGCNLIHGSLPTTVDFGLPHLEFFSVAENRFVGSIPPSIPNNARSLLILQLGRNNLSGKVPSFESSHNLQWLSLNNNHLGSGGSSDLSFLCSLTNSTSLIYLNIFSSRLGGRLPICIGNFSVTIKTLELGFNPIIGEIPRAIGNLVNLESLEMSNAILSGDIPFEVGNLKNLTELLLSNNNLSGIIPSSMQKFKKLIYLYLDRNHFHGHIPSNLDKCQSLMYLDLSNNNLSGSIFPVVKTLFFLSLSDNHLDGALPAQVAEIDHLGVLDISGNMYGGEIPSTLGNCVDLIELSMEDNHFQRSIPQSIRSLQSIEILNLSNNNLSGEIPKFLGAFDFLQILDLSYNNFEGVLPTEGVFKNASATFITGNNKICGGIPKFQLPECISRHSKSKRVVCKLKLALSIIFGLLGGVLVLVFVYVWWLKKKKKKTREPTSSCVSKKFQKLSYGTLLKATDGFSSTNLIGVGSFGSVYKGTLQENGTNVAVKVLNLTRHGALKGFKAEFEALKSIKHRNLLKVLTVCSSIDYDGNDFKALVFELMVNGSLEEWLHPYPIPTNADGPSKNLSLIQRIKISINIAFALDYLHNQCHSTIIHCDLKPSNVLLDAEMVGHVGDFGLAKIILESTSYSKKNISSVGLRGTIGYVAPEYGMGSEVSIEGDVYSYGIILLEMFTRINPTSEIFKENLNLHNFVKEALPERALDITDPTLVQEVESNAGQSRKCTIQDCLLMVYGIGIACSVGVPGERMRIADVAAKLCSIRDKLYVAGL